MSKKAERKFWRCIWLSALFIGCIWGLSLIAPDAPIPEALFTIGLSSAVVGGLIFG